MTPPHLDEAVTECLMVLRDVYSVDAPYLEVVKRQFAAVYAEGVLDGVERTGAAIGLWPQAGFIPPWVLSRKKEP